MKVIIAGCRNFNNYEVAKKHLDFLFQNTNEYEIVSGDCIGADKLGERFANENNRKIKKFPANWNDLSHPDASIKINKAGNKYDERAGYRRNQKMAEYGDSLVAFWDGISRGTKMMIDIMKKKEKRVVVISI